MTTIMEKTTIAETMRKDIPAGAAAAAAEADAERSLHLPGATWARPAVRITEVLSMTERSLILLMTAANRWNLSVEQDR